MKLTFRNTFALGLAPTLALGLYAGHAMSSGTDYQAPTSTPTTSLEVTPSTFKDPLSEVMLKGLYYTGVDIEEDGSGTQYIRGHKVRTFPEDTFAWDCRTMGNRKCGPRT